MSGNHASTTLINTAVIVIGSYHVPASVAFGALVGASLFILSRNGYASMSKAWLFAVSFFTGIFGGSDAANIVNWYLPQRSALQVNEFFGSVIAAAFIVIAVQTLYGLIDKRKAAALDVQRKDT